MECYCGKIGIIKEIDNLGRIVMPKEHRERFGLQKKVEVIITQEGILIRYPEYQLIRAKDFDDKNENNNILK